MIYKRILVIDDAEQNDILKKLQRDVRKRINVILDCDYLYVGGQDASIIIDDDGNLDVQSVKNAISNRLKKRHYDIVACDYDLAVSNISGTELIRLIRGECFNNRTKFLIYSGLLDQIIKDEIGNECSVTYDNDKTVITPSAKLVARIKHLVNSDYIGFVLRDDYPESIVKHLKDDITIADVLEEVITRYPELQLKYGFGHGFEGQSLSDLRNQINTSDDLRYDVLRDLLEQTIIYLTKKLS